MSLSGHFASWRCTWIRLELTLCSFFAGVAGGNDFQWCFSQVKGAIDEDVAEGMWLTLAWAARLKRWAATEGALWWWCCGCLCIIMHDIHTTQCTFSAAGRCGRRTSIYTSNTLTSFPPFLKLLYVVSWLYASWAIKGERLYPWRQCAASINCRVTSFLFSFIHVHERECG